MFQLPSFRSRQVQLLIFGLTCLSFYAYYYTLTSEVHLQAALSSVGRSTSSSARINRDDNQGQLYAPALRDQNSPNVTVLSAPSSSQYSVAATGIADSRSMDAKVADAIWMNKRNDNPKPSEPKLGDLEAARSQITDFEVVEMQPDNPNETDLNGDNAEATDPKIGQENRVKSKTTDENAPQPQHLQLKSANSKVVESTALESEASEPVVAKEKDTNPKNVNEKTTKDKAADTKAVETKIAQGSVQQPPKVVKTVETGVAPGVYDSPAGAIYASGHSTAIPEMCPNFGAGMDLAILIMSAPDHFESRTAIRQTWGHFGQRRDIAIAFLLGQTVDEKIEVVLEHEDAIYGDIIRGNFFDSYSNLTLKTISMLEWINEYCSQVAFVLKTDDDMFINVPRLISFIKKHSNEKNVIYGRLARKWKPIRNIKSKYFVSRVQYKPEVFPDFTTGPAYLLSSDVVEKLYRASLEQTYLKLEDVFTTGIVANKLGIKRYQANEFTNKRISFNTCVVQKSISIHMVKHSEQFDLWKKLLDGKTKCK